MHEVQSIVTDDRGVCPSVCQSVSLSVSPSVTRLNSAACNVCRVIRCSLCQITLAFCLSNLQVHHRLFCHTGTIPLCLEAVANLLVLCLGIFIVTW